MEMRTLAAGLAGEGTDVCCRGRNCNNRYQTSLGKLVEVLSVQIVFGSMIQRKYPVAQG